MIVESGQVSDTLARRRHLHQEPADAFNAAEPIFVDEILGHMHGIAAVAVAFR